MDLLSDNVEAVIRPPLSPGKIEDATGLTFEEWSTNLALREQAPDACGHN